MDKGKQKVHEQLFAEVVKSIPAENKNPTPSGDSKAPPLSGNPNKQKNKKQARKNQKNKYGKEDGEPSSGVSSINAASFFSKLSLVKENFQSLEETTLLGFLVGKHVDFNKKVSKLKYDWKNINGEIDFYDRQMGWFEMRFSNPIDKLRVWEGRPYHLFSQLLLLKPWCSSFNPTTEPIFMVDMWVRIPFLPPEYYNFEAISTILEFNNIGRLIKLDPNANKRNWAKFARFCINLDCSELVNTEILVPNEVGELKKYRLWFEDIPKGCGNCGGFDHEFYNCPLRRFIPPKFQIKFKKQAGEESDLNKKQDGWEEVKGRFKKKQISASNRASPKALQKEENYGGIAVVYITDGSSVESKESPITSSKLSKCSSGNTIEISTKNEDLPPNNVDVNGPFCEEVPNQNNKGDKTEAAFNLPLTESNLEGASALANNLVPIPILSDLGINVVTPPGEENSKFKDQLNSEFYYEGDVEDGDFEIDYLVDEIPFLEGNTGEQTNYCPLPDFPTVEEMPFFPMETGNIIFRQAEAMEAMVPIPSSSGSCKRKTLGGDGDTASSNNAGNKKPKT